MTSEQFSENKLIEYERKMYKQCSKLKNKKTLSVVTPLAALVIYIVFIRLSSSLMGFCVMQEKQGLDIIIMGFNLGKSSMAATATLFIACQLAALVISIIVTVILNIVFNSVNKACEIKSDSTVERIKNLIEEANKYIDKKIGVFEVKVKNKSLIKTMLISGAVIYMAVAFIPNNTVEGVGALMVYGVFVCLPTLIVCKIIDIINSAFSGKIDKEIYRTLDSWWVELDPEEKKRRKDAKFAEAARKDRLLSLYAKATVREKAKADAHAAAMKEWENWV